MLTNSPLSGPTHLARRAVAALPQRSSRSPSRSLQLSRTGAARVVVAKPVALASVLCVAAPLSPRKCGLAQLVRLLLVALPSLLLCVRLNETMYFKVLKGIVQCSAILYYCTGIPTCTCIIVLNSHVFSTVF